MEKNYYLYNSKKEEFFMIQSYLSQVNAIDVITFIFYILILYIAFLYTLRIILNWKYNNKMSKVIQEEKSMINAL